MAVVRYIAKRSLTGGVSVDTQITRNLPLAAEGGLTRSRETFKSLHISLARVRETLYYADEITWSCQTIGIRGQTQLDLVMFLDSVSRGEAFEFSPYQIIGDTITWTTGAYVDQGGYQEARVLPLGGSAKGSTDYFAYGFAISTPAT